MIYSDEVFLFQFKQFYISKAMKHMWHRVLQKEQAVIIGSVFEKEKPRCQGAEVWEAPLRKGPGLVSLSRFILFNCHILVTSPLCQTQCVSAVLPPLRCLSEFPLPAWSPHALCGLQGLRLPLHTHCYLELEKSPAPHSLLPPCDSFPCASRPSLGVFLDITCIP